jgi:glycosyltransferase involved in cell wall biosynthesis
MQQQNILAIISYPFLPATTGGEISTLNILKYMSHVHNVTVFTVEPYKSDFDIGTAKFELIFGMPFKVNRYYNILLLAKARKLIGDKQIDWVFFDQPWLGWLLWLLKVITRKKIFIRSNNIEYLRFRSMGKWYWPLLYIYEKWTYRAADLVIFVSDTDRLKAINQFGLEKDKTLLTPYGVELESAPVLSSVESFSALRDRLGISSGEKMILFFSTLSYKPNYEAVQFIANDIYPRLKLDKSYYFKIVICGKGLPDKIKELLIDKPEIIYTGFVDDINLYIDAADLMINPLLSGGGVKTKVIDTLARGQRVVSTVNGAEGIDPSVCGDCLIICPDYDWDLFANAITKDNTVKSLSNSFYETYGWRAIIYTLTDKLISYK